MHARQRPGNARGADARMKLHRRTVRGLTVIGLRPGTDVRFSTNYFHETWHLLSDPHGARVLGRLLWGLAYQARPGTVVLIDRPFIDTTPFDGDPGCPIVLVPGWVTHFGRRRAAELGSRLPLRSSPDGTVRWQTHGLDSAVRWSERCREGGWVDRLGGLVVVNVSSPAEARDWATRAAGLKVDRYPMDYEYLGPWPREGEIQIFADYRQNVRIARRARGEVPAQPDPDQFRMSVWHRFDETARAWGRGQG